MSETIRVPTAARYHVIDGKPIIVDAEWCDVPVEPVAAMLARAFRLGQKEGERSDA